MPTSTELQKWASETTQPNSCENLSAASTNGEKMITLKGRTQFGITEPAPEQMLVKGFSDEAVPHSSRSISISEIY